MSSRRTLLHPTVCSGTLRGLSSAEWLAVLTLVGLVLWASVPRAVRWHEASNHSAAQARMRNLALAVDAYFVDHEAYPASGIASGGGRSYDSQQIWQPQVRSQIASDVPTIHSFARENAGARRLVTFRIAQRHGAQGFDLATLTTPVGYLGAFPEDPFATTPNATFGYFAHESQLGWILFSMGPDRDENTKGGPGDISPRVERVYNINSEFPYMWQPSNELTALRYEPTNGIFSNGDLYRVQGE